MTMMVFVLIVLENGKPTGEEFWFRELTSCVEYSRALNTNSVHQHNMVMPKIRFFETYCRVREIKTSEAGTKILFRDPIVKDDSE